MEFKGSWDTHLALMEFAYNNNYQANIEMSSFEVLCMARNVRLQCTGMRLVRGDW